MSVFAKTRLICVRTVSTDLEVPADLHGLGELGQEQGLTLAVAMTGDFSQTNDCGATVLAGSSCSINVTFTPTATGARSGALTFTDNAAGSPQSVALSGIGLAPIVSLTPATEVFGNQAVGSPLPAV